MQKLKLAIQKIFSVILNSLIVIIAVLTIVAIYYVFQTKILHKDYANLFGFTMFEIATGSMSSTIEIGDVIITKITQDVNEGDIIVYKEGDYFITHRLIEEQGKKLIAKGDANNSEDKPIEKEQVLGKVIKIIPKVGVLRDVILTPEIIGLIIAIIVLIGVFINYPVKTEEEDE